MTDEIKSTAEEQDKTQNIADHKQTDAGQETKTFTQADVDKIISERLKREREKLPNDEELKAYKEWKKSQQTEAERTAEREKKYAEIEAKAETIRRENLALKAGVNIDDVDYVLFKVGKLDGEFDANLKDFLTENKKYTEPATETVAGTKHNPSTTDQDANFIAAVRRGAGLK